MWIKLFFSHLKKSIKTNPLQPVLSVFLLFICFVLIFLTFNVTHWMSVQTDNRRLANYGKANITVSVNSHTQNRFLQTEEVKEVVGGDVVAGIYELPMYTEDGSFVFVCASDYEEYCNIFNVEFLSFAPVTSLVDSAFVTTKFATKHHLQVGDTFSLKFQETLKQFKVFGISEKPFTDEHDVLISINGVMRMMAVSSPIITAFGDDFKLYSRIYISANDPSATCSALRSDARFADKTVERVDELVDFSSFMEPLNYVTTVMVGFVALLSAIIVLNCFFILNTKRSQENALFQAVGVKPSTLTALQCLEIFIYFFIAVALGIVVCIAISPIVLRLCGFNYVASPFTEKYVLNCVYSFLMTLFSAVITSVFYYVSERYAKKIVRKERKTNLVFVIFGVVIVAVLTALSYILNSTINVAVSSFAIASFLIGAYVVIAKLFSSHAKLLSKKVVPHRVCLSYSLKNAVRVKPLHNTVRLISVLVAISSLIFVLFNAGEVYMNVAENFISCDYVVLNATEDSSAKIESLSDVESATPIYFGTGILKDGFSVQVISSDDPTAFDVGTPFSRAPKGDEIFMVSGYAERMGAKVGDKVSIAIEGNDYEFTISNIFRSNLNCIYFDSSVHPELSDNIIAVRGVEGADSDELFTHIAESMSLQMAAVMPTDEFFEHRIDMFYVYVNGGKVMFYGMLLFAIIGLIDNVYESYRFRKEEFELYKNCGVTKGGITKIKTFEIVFTFIFGVAASLIVLTYLLFMVQRMMLSLAIDILCTLSV